MRSLKRLALLILLSLCHTSLYSYGLFEDPCIDPCDLYDFAQRATLRHIEAKGVGYHKGYTSLDFFLAPKCMLETHWIPFAEVRVHGFNDGRGALNAGAGLRYLCGDRFWGFNTFYDYRNTHRHHYNQVGIGFESLGAVWDFRLNGYFPCGKRATNGQFAMNAGNAEVGALITQFDCGAVYAAANTYYMNNHHKHAWGGGGRVVLNLWKYLTLQVNGSYDRIFKGIVQGQIALTYPFGEGKDPCSAEGMLVYEALPTSLTQPVECPNYALISSALQRVERNDMIIIDHAHHR